MQTETTHHPSVQTLADFGDDCRSLDLKQFCKRHGDAFLLHYGALERLRPPAMIGATLSIESGSERTLPDGALPPQTDFLVFPVMRPNPDGTLVDMVWVGRSEFNEVVIPDATISEVQAFLRRESNGEYFVQDTGSRNGTYVDGKRVPAQGLGAPVPLRSGVRIRMGEVTLTFLLAEPFRTLVHRLVG
jgi:hypothetical protein